MAVAIPMIFDSITIQSQFRSTMTPMHKRVAQISYHYQPIIGGQEVYIADLLRVLKSSGYDNRVYQRMRHGVHQNDEVIPVFHLPFVGKYLKDWDRHLFSLFLYLTKTSALSKEDVIIVHYASHSLSVWNLRHKVIVLSHGIEWNLESSSVGDRLREFIARKAFDRFPLVANDTHYLRYFGVRVEPGQGYFEEVARNKWFIPNCVDRNVFQRKDPLPDLRDKKVILVPRQIVPDRGIDLALNAFRLFREKHEDFYMYFVGGPTSGKYYEFCVALGKKLGISEKIRFLGYVKNRHMPNYYSSAELCLIPTRRREGTSLSALESMACGTATVSTNVAGLRDLPTIQAEPNASDVADKLIYTLENQKEIARQQSHYTRTIFTMENWRDAWLRVIKQVTG